jgi:hypothetical protein
MKRTLLLLSLLITVIAAVVLLGCANAAVESAISDFKNAVNHESPSELKNALSPESTMYITEGWDWLISDYFHGNIPVNYSGYSINVSGANADARVSATYASIPVTDGAWFWFKRENTFLSFLFPSYKVYRYYDGYNGFTDPDAIWKKVKSQKAQ